MKITLINPSQFMVYGSMRPPLQLHMGLAYLAAFIKKHSYNVEIIDMDAESISLDELAVRMAGEFSDLVGVTVTTPTLAASLEVAEAVKRASQNTKVVFGGMHPSVMPNQTISNKDVDFLIKGEGELTLLELAQALQGAGDFRGIDGLLFKEKEEVVENKPRELISDLDTLPFPARSLFKNSSYTYPDALHASCAPMITSRGCPGRCTYCNAHSIFGRRFRARSAENVVDEMELLSREFNIKEIHIWDDNFVTQKNRVFNIRDEINRRGLRIKFAFPNGIRADFINREVLKALKDMGTYSIAIGVESGNQRVLDKAKKGIRLNDVVKAFELARGMGLETWAFFMFGLPGEDMDAAYDTIAFAMRLNPDIAKFHILKPYPGTEIYNYMLSNDLLSSRDYNNYGIHTAPVHHLDGLTEADLLKVQQKAYREFYFRPGKILNQISRIRSFNRLRLNIKAAFDITGLILRKQKG